MSSRYLEVYTNVFKKKDYCAKTNQKDQRYYQKTNLLVLCSRSQKGKHDWVYDLDITSMYPSCIMSLNISPETKIGKIVGWNPEEFLSKNKKTYTIEQDGKEMGKFTETELGNFFRWS